MMRRAISNKKISAIHLPIREPFLLFSPGLAGLYGLFGLYIFCASLPNFEHPMGLLYNNYKYLSLCITSQHEEGCLFTVYA